MSIQSVDVSVMTSIHPDVAKRVSLVALLYSCAMLLAGIFLFVLDFELHTHSTSVSMLLMVAGTALVLFGVYSLFWRSREMVYLPTGSVTKEYSLFFDLKHLNALTEALNNNRLGGDIDIRSSASGNVRLDVMLSRDGKFAAVQLFQFVPYVYTPITEVRYYVGSEAGTVAAFVLKNRR